MKTFGLRPTAMMFVVILLHSNPVSADSGSGSNFAGAITNSVGLYAQVLTAGDFNRDGKLDLAVVKGVFDGVWYAKSVFVLLGNGDGTFQTGSNYYGGLEPTHAMLGDFNADGILDLVVANSGRQSPPNGNWSGNVSILLGKGDGTFQDGVFYDAGTYPASVATGDLNADGKLDLVVANYIDFRNVSVLLGNGNGTLQPAVHYSVLNLPNLFPDERFSESVAVADFSGDGKPDLVVANLDDYNGQPGSLSLLVGKGDGTLLATNNNYTAGTGPISVAVEDFNRDGKPDAVVGDVFSTNVSVLLGKGDGTFQDAVKYTVGGRPGVVAVSDFNIDGKPDLAVLNQGGSISVLMGKGDGTFASSVNLPVGDAVNSLVVGDFNGDGLPDLAVADGTNVMVLLNASTPVSVRLDLRRSKSNAVVNWAFPSTGFVLESTTSVTDTNWVPAIEVAKTNSGRWEVIAPLDLPQRFFRLRRK